MVYIAYGICEESGVRKKRERRREAYHSAGDLGSVVAGQGEHDAGAGEQGEGGAEEVHLGCFGRTVVLNERVSVGVGRWLGGIKDDVSDARGGRAISCMSCHQS